MKIKIKKFMSKSYTCNSPYFEENGEHIHEWTEACCGNCGRSIEEAHFYKSWNYCPYCDEKIDWIENA